MWLLATATAATVAVLPLEPSSEDHPGLGVPLAGMLLADLAEVPELTLVERSRLDALLAEIDLGEQGFLDPETAQTAGKGLGAEFVVVGSYGVINDQFVLNARIVSVETGDIVEAASATGSLQDFVAVEKELVEALVDDLDLELSGAARRKVIVQTPTESFDALSAYGQGLDAQERGDLDAASASWSQALIIDPSYQAPKTALSELKAGVEERADARHQAAVDEWYAVRRAALTATPSEIDDPSDNRQLAALSLHLDMLTRLDRDCEKYEVMWAHARKHGLPEHHDTYPEFLAESYGLHVELGLIDPQDNWGENKVQSSGVNLFRREESYLFELIGWAADPRIVESDGLLGAIERCFPVDQRPEKVRQARVLVEVAGVADTPLREGKPETLGEVMRLHEAYAFAAAGRLEEADIADLVTQESKWVDQHLARVVRAAEVYEVRRAQRLGLEPEVLWGITRAYATKDKALIQTDDDWCRELIRLKTDMARFRLEQLAEGEQDEDWITHQLWSVVAAPRDLGCLVGVPARFESTEAVYDHVLTAKERLRVDAPEHCAETADGLASQFDVANIVQEPSRGQMNAMLAAVALDSYYRSLVIPRCVSD